MGLEEFEQDKRKFTRAAFREAVQYRFADHPASSGTVGFDLSEGGVRFRTEEFLPFDAEVVIHLQLKAEREATLLARVVWAQKVPYGDSYHVGCEFLENRENVFPRFVVKNFLELHQT